MMGKTITQNERKDLLSILGDNCDDPDTVLIQMMAEIGWSVGPAPILPGVTGGEWVITGPYGDGHYSISAQYRGSGPVLAKMIVRDDALANGKVMAGSKKLVKLLVKRFQKRIEENGNHYPWSQETCAILDQLEKMGVDVTKFRG